MNYIFIICYRQEPSCPRSDEECCPWNSRVDLTSGRAHRAVEPEADLAVEAVPPGAATAVHQAAAAVVHALEAWPAVETVCRLAG